MTAPARPLYDIREVVGMLADRVDELAAELLPGGQREGHEWVCGSVDGEPGRSLSVNLTSHKGGVWADFSTGEVGDALDLVAACLYAGDKKRAFAWARRWLGLEARDPMDVAKAKARAQAAQARRMKAANTTVANKKGAALRILFGAQDKLAGTPVDLYLKGRGIDLARLGRPPSMLRYSPDLVYRWQKPGAPPHKDPRAGEIFPGMVAGVVNMGGETIAIHRTFLELNAAGLWDKAAVIDSKMTLAELDGGFIPLWRGASGRPWKEPDEGEVMAITEGIEDALTVALARPQWRVISACNLRNLHALQLLPAYRDLVVCADNDKGVKEQALLRACVQRLLGQGRRVRVARAPKGKDMNDLLRGKE